MITTIRILHRIVRGPARFRPHALKMRDDCHTNRSSRNSKNFKMFGCNTRPKVLMKPIAVQYTDWSVCTHFSPMATKHWYRSRLQKENDVYRGTEISCDKTCMGNPENIHFSRSRFEKIPFYHFYEKTADTLNFTKSVYTYAYPCIPGAVRLFRLIDFCAGYKSIYFFFFSIQHQLIHIQYQSVNGYSGSIDL